MSEVTIELAAATIASLGLDPGDVIVVTVTDVHCRLTSEQAATIMETVKAAVGDHQIIVLPYGLELSKLELVAA